MQTKIEMFLASQIILHISCCIENMPWVCALEYTHDSNFNIYWQSSATSRHSQYLSKNKNCSIAISYLDADNKSTGVQMEGYAEKINDPLLSKDTKNQLMHKRNKQVNEEINAVESTRRCWVFHPTKIYYLNEKEFGYKRIEINLDEVN